MGTAVRHGAAAVVAADAAMVTAVCTTSIRPKPCACRSPESVRQKANWRGYASKYCSKLWITLKKEININYVIICNCILVLSKYVYDWLFLYWDT